MQLSYRAAYGCTAKVRIPVEDPDGDIVRCRWAKTSECGAGCTNTPLNAVRLSKVVIAYTVKQREEIVYCLSSYTESINF